MVSVMVRWLVCIMMVDVNAAVPERAAHDAR